MEFSLTLSDLDPTCLIVQTWIALSVAALIWALHSER